MSYPSGNYYEGYWALDNKEGKGTMFWVTSNEKVKRNSDYLIYFLIVHRRMGW